MFDLDLASRVEKVDQVLPVHTPYDGESAPSVPLHSLVDLAPEIPESPYMPHGVYFPFSNDESPLYFQQLVARTQTAEYQQATNRVALIVGESSLASAVQFIPEDTIVVLDSSDEMCVYIRDYVDSISNANTLSDWKELMGFNRPEFVKGIMNGDLERYAQKLFEQVDEWEDAGIKHALYDENAFAAAKAALAGKVVIPWHADIADKQAIAGLAEALRSHDATITMANLTNVIPYDRTFNETSDYVDILSQLPFTPYAPIMATNTSGKALLTKEDVLKDLVNPDHIVQATGPFFGLDNLATGGKIRSGWISRRPGTISARQYHETTIPEKPLTIQIKERQELLAFLEKGVLQAQAQRDADDSQGRLFG